MATEKQLRKQLAAAFSALRDQQNAIFSLVAEIAALRESLIQIGGQRYDAILTRQRTRHVAASKEPSFERTREYDDVIRRLNDDELP